MVPSAVWIAKDDIHELSEDISEELKMLGMEEPKEVLRLPRKGHLAALQRKPLMPGLACGCHPTR